MKFNVLVGDAMTRTIKHVDMGDTVEKAAQVMRDNKIGSVVVMGDKNVKGIVTSMDIVYKYVAEKKGERVSDIMTTDPIKISPSQTIEEAARTMIKYKIEKLLVFDMDRLVGIISNNDIIRVEPALIEILLERLKMGAAKTPQGEEITECESCGNYADDIEEVNGEYVCAECRMVV